MDAVQPPMRSVEEELRREVAALRQGLAEAQARNHELMETIDAIRLGAVDAIVVAEGDQYRVYTLEGANYPYRALVENIQEGALTLTVDGVILFANAAFAALRGLPLADLVGTVLVDHVADRDRPRVRRMLEAARKGARRGETDICSGSGSVPVQISMTPITVNEDTTISVVVTDRREDYGRLRLLGRMLDSVVDAVTATDPDGTIVYWNEAAERLYGWTASEMVGRPFTATLEPGAAEEEARRVFRELSAGLIWSGEHAARHRDGHRLMVQATGAPVFDEDGRLLAVIGTSRDISERKASEAALRASEEALQRAAQRTESDRQRLETILETIPSAVVLVEAADGRFSYMNRRATELYGRSYVGIGLDEHVAYVRALRLDGTPYPLEEMPVARSLATGEAVRSVEMVIERADGLRIPVAVSSAPLRDAAGTITTAIVTFEDITERKRAEAALRSAADRQGLLAEVAARLLSADEPQAIVDDLCRRALGVLDCDVFFNYLADAETGRLRLNACAGIPADEAERIGLLDYGAAVCGCVARDGCRIVAESIPLHPDPRTDLVAGYGVRAYACHPLVVEGTTIGTLSFGTRSRDAFSADDLATMKAIADLIAIAMQRIADREALRRRSEELEAVMDLVPAAIWVGHDQACTRITGNRVANEFYEAEPGENVSAGAPSSPRAFFAPDGRRLEAGELPMQVAAARNEAVPNAEFEVELPSGRRRHLLGSAVPLREADGASRGAVAAFFDITPRKEDEAKLARFAERLQQSNEELQRFAYVASHDLQEPLRSIVSFSQLLERRYRGRLDQDADDYIGFIVGGGVRMQALIRDLLQVSRLETAAKPPEPTDAGAVVRDALALMNGQIRELGGTVTVGELPTVMADPAQLEQVFVNLVGNAVKYRRPEVPLEVRVEAVRVGPMVEFSVQDNGIGIEEQYFDRIFEMFRRLHTHDQYEGTGIGLAVVKRIVERHGGRIRVESVPGEGSAFYFTLPAA